MKRPQPGDYFAFEAPDDSGSTSIVVTDDGSTFRLPDGRILVALPQNDDEYLARAASLGYPSALAMAQEHDLLHARLAHALGLPVSPALVAAANGEAPTELYDAEEAMVLAAARFLNLMRRQAE